MYTFSSDAQSCNFANIDQEMESSSVLESNESELSNATSRATVTEVLVMIQHKTSVVVSMGFPLGLIQHKTSVSW